MSHSPSRTVIPAITAVGIPHGESLPRDTLISPIRAPVPLERHMIYIGNNVDQAGDLEIIQALQGLQGGVDTVSVTACATCWTEARQQTIEEAIPPWVTYEIRIISPNSDSEVIVAKDYGFHPPLEVSSISFPIDLLDADMTIRTLSLVGLRILHLLPPLSSQKCSRKWQSIIKEIKILINSLPKKLLEKIAIPLDLHPKLWTVFKPLLEFQNLREVDIIPSYNFDNFAVEDADRMNMEFSIIRMLECCVQLEKITIPLSTISPLLLEFIFRLPNLRSFEGRPASNLFHNEYHLQTEQYKELVLNKDFSKSGHWTWP